MNRVGQFIAVDGGGKRYTVQVYVDCATAGTVPGVTQLVAADGRRVPRVEQGEYEFVDTGARLRSHRGDAP